MNCWFFQKDDTCEGDPYPFCGPDGPTLPTIERKRGWSDWKTLTMGYFVTNSATVCMNKRKPMVTFLTMWVAEYPFSPKATWAWDPSLIQSGDLCLGNLGWPVVFAHQAWTNGFRYQTWRFHNANDGGQHLKMLKLWLITMIFVAGLRMNQRSLWMTGWQSGCGMLDGP